MKINKMKTIEIEISGKFGSKFQEKFAIDSLLGILRAWGNFVKNTHKDNEVSISLTDKK